MNQIPMNELVEQIEEMLAVRGNTPNVISQYHYIFTVMLAFFNSHRQKFYSKDLMERCLKEHYGIIDYSILLRQQYYKKMVVRASRMIEDIANGYAFKDRYLSLRSQSLNDDFNIILTTFLTHLQEIGRSEKTIQKYSRDVSRFLDFVDNYAESLSSITIEHVYSYVQTYSGQKKATVKSALGPVRIFLHFLYTEKYTESDLSLFVEKVKTRTQTKIPSVWEKEEVLKLLAAIDRGNPSGKRDYAIILLVARLGIRIGDVNNLKFENIDWSKNCISFMQKKTHSPICLPLLKDVGWAIIDYVQNGRPKIDSPYIFLTHISPYKNYSDDNHLHSTIKKYLTLTDIQNRPAKKRGMHSLRHTLANQLQENKETLHTISSALGHSSPDSASAYVKTDIEFLRECVLSLSEVKA